MITIWNRRELFSTYDIKKQSRIRDILAQNQIDYTIKIINRQSYSQLSPAAARVGRAGQNMDLACEYKIYVHKEELEKANFLLRSEGVFCREG